MEGLELLVDLHRDGARQGPGGDAETQLALRLAALDRTRPLRVADIGCGTGASSVVLAQALDAHVVAVDFFREFLDALRARASQLGVGDRITTLAASMDALPFEAEEFDLVWSEGGVYNIGFEAGIAYWRRFLKPGGVLAVSEITWLTDTRPAEIEEHWTREYPEMAPASEQFGVLERNGYTPIGYFALPEHCWLDHYYRPLQQRFPDFLRRHGHSAEALASIAMEEKEIALYEQYRAYFSYGFYIARRGIA